MIDFHLLFVQTLYLTGSNSVTDSLIEIFSLYNTSLERLYLSRCQHLTGKTMHLLFENCEKLRVFIAKIS